MTSINCRTGISRFNLSVDSQMDLQSETLIQATLSQDKDGSLCLKQQIAFDETKVRFFRDDTTLKE